MCSMKKLVLLAGAALILAATTTTAYFLRPHPAAPKTAHHSASDEGSEPTHPLMIEAIRSRGYTASPIVLERDVGASAGFSSQVVSYKSDGFKVNALMTIPAGPAPAAGWPVIIVAHGYIPPQQYQTLGGDYQYWIEGLTRAGFVVIKPDYRGHGTTQGTPEGGHWSPYYTYDVLNLIESLKKHPGVDAGHIGLAGHSMGGMVVLRAAVASKDVKATAILAGVVASAPDLYYNWRNGNWSPPPGMLTTNNREELVKGYGDPKANPEFWHKISAIDYVKDIAGPVQIHHGTADDTVPIAQSASLDAALTKAGRPHEYFVYEGGTHQFNGNSDLALSRLMALFNSTLKS
jgi:dipeptidyl aminopeptidase/acylaminoacyl peptidase